MGTRSLTVVFYKGEYRLHTMTIRTATRRAAGSRGKGMKSNDLSNH